MLVIFYILISKKHLPAMTRQDILLYSFVHLLLRVCLLLLLCTLSNLYCRVEAYKLLAYDALSFEGFPSINMYSNHFVHSMLQPFHTFSLHLLSLCFVYFYSVFSILGEKMSSTSGLYQGLQSCFEPQPIKSLVLRPKLDPPKLEFSISSDEEVTNHNGEAAVKGEWSFLQELSIQNEVQENDHQKIYVPSLFKRSSSTLSEKSLEMCTENLGSETGTNNTSQTSSNNNIHLGPIEKGKNDRKNRSVNGRRSFPLPLTSINGKSRMKLEPCREGGRLVVKAVSDPSSNTSYFHVERGPGWLRLHLMRDCCDNCENEVGEEEGKKVGEEEGDGNTGEEEGEGEELEGNNGNVGDETGRGKFPWPSRCKEGDGGKKGLLNWKPCWVTRLTT